MSALAITTVRSPAIACAWAIALATPSATNVNGVVPAGAV